MQGEEDYAWRRNDANAEERFVWPPQTEVQVQDMVQDAFARANEIHDNEAGFDKNPLLRDNGNALDGSVEVNMANMEELIQENIQPLYEGCAVNRLQASIVLMNMANLYGVPHTFMDEMLSFLSSDLLPQSNCLPQNTYEMKKIIMKMDLEHRAIHCCPNGHVLYEGAEHEDLSECPECGVSRYINGFEQIPRKVMRYFPIIPHLQRLFRCPEVASLMKWHVTNKSEDGLMQSVVDSP